MNWYKLDTLEYRASSPDLAELSNKQFSYAIFDIDNTLITKSNGKPSYYTDLNSSNWIWLGPIQLVLNIYKSQGYIVCWYTNQSKYNPQTKAKFEQMSSYIFKTYGWDI